MLFQVAIRQVKEQVELQEQSNIEFHIIIANVEGYRSGHCSTECDPPIDFETTSIGKGKFSPNLVDGQNNIVDPSPYNDIEDLVNEPPRNHQECFYL